MRNILMFAGGRANKQTNKSPPRLLSEHFHDNSAEYIRLKIFKIGARGNHSLFPVQTL